MPTARIRMDARDLTEVQVYPETEDGEFTVVLDTATFDPDGTPRYSAISFAIGGTPAEMEALGRALITAIASGIAGENAEEVVTVPMGGTGTEIAGLLVDGGIIEFPQAVR